MTKKYPESEELLLLHCDSVSDYSDYEDNSVNSIIVLTSHKIIDDNMKYLAAAFSERIKLFCINTLTGEYSLCLTIPFSNDEITSLAELSDGSLLAIANKDEKTYIKKFNLFLAFYSKLDYENFYTGSNLISFDERIDHVLALSGNRFAAFTDEGNVKEDSICIRVFDYSIKEIGVLKGHQYGVVSALEVRTKLISCGVDLQIKVWNLNKYQLECVITFIQINSNIIYHNNKLILGGNNNLYMFNVFTMKIEKTIQKKGIGKIIKLMLARDGNIVAINEKKNCFFGKYK